MSNTGLTIEQISIHALREEGDAERRANYDSAGRFLSTPSARRATRQARQVSTGYGHFYPRPPRGGRRYGGGQHC